MSAVERLWIRHVKQSPAAHSDFLTWIGEESEKVRNEYKRSITLEDFLQTKADEEALDKLRRIFTMQDRENRSVAQFKRG